MPKNFVVSARMSVEDLAKARDGLIAKGIQPAELTISQIIKLTFYYGIINICQNSKEAASIESTNLITQKLNKTKTKVLKLNDL